MDPLRAALFVSLRVPLCCARPTPSAARASNAARVAATTPAAAPAAPMAVSHAPAVNDTASPADPAFARLDASRDDDAPDTQPAALVTFARRLASTVRGHAAELSMAKLDAAQAAASLEAGAALLLRAQHGWTQSRASEPRAVMAALREAVRAGADDVYYALRVFAKADASLQAALDDVGRDRAESTLLADASLLATLAEAHASSLAGTDITPAVVARLRRDVEALGAASSADRGDAVVALRLRNRAYWHLATLARDVCERGRYAFRRDARIRARYAAPRVKRARTAAVTPTPTPTPSRPPTG